MSAARATFKDKQPLKTLARASQSCATQVRSVSTSPLHPPSFFPPPSTASPLSSEDLELTPVHRVRRVHRAQLPGGAPRHVQGRVQGVQGVCPGAWSSCRLRSVKLTSRRPLGASGRPWTVSQSSRWRSPHAASAISSDPPHRRLDELVYRRTLWLVSLTSATDTPLEPTGHPGHPNPPTPRSTVS
jgi:hypothetical protein